MQKVTTSHHLIVPPYAKVVGLWLAVGAVLVIGGNLVHLAVPEGPTLADTMASIQTQPTLWQLSHLLIGFGYITTAMGALVALVNNRYELPPIAVIGLTLLTLFSLPLYLYLIVEATVATHAAVAGNIEAFGQWYGSLATYLWRFSWPGYIFGLLLLALAEVRTDVPLLPHWSAWTAICLSALSALAPLGSAYNLPGNIILFFAGPLAIIWQLAWGVAVHRQTVSSRDIEMEVTNLSTQAPISR